MRRPGKIRAHQIDGSTDMQGDDAYNMDLSARRLTAVRDYLVLAGYRGQIELVPLGKREPFQLDDPGRHSQGLADDPLRQTRQRRPTRAQTARRMFSATPRLNDPGPSPAARSKMP
jgi:outer membrane protein OmpA-like peptidoglycan-associated protein